MFDHHHRSLELGLDLLDERSERFGLSLGHAAGRLIEQQHACVDGQEAAELNDAASACRERLDEGVRVAAQPEIVDYLVGFAPLGSLVGARRWQRQHRRHEPRMLTGLQRDHQRLANRETRVQAGCLEPPPESETVTGRGAAVGDVCSKDFDRALGGNESADRVEQGRLSGAVGADQTDQFSLVNLEINVGHGDVASKANGDSPRRERWTVDRGRIGSRRCRNRLALDNLGRVPGLAIAELAVGHRQQPVANRIDDLQQSSREVHEQHQQADVGGEQLLQIAELIRDQSFNAQNPERAENRSGNGPQAPDNGDYDHPQ